MYSTDKWSLIQLLKYIHFNPEHIENQNIKIPNKKEPYAEVFNGSIWEISDKKRTIKDMTDQEMDDFLELKFEINSEINNEFNEDFINNYNTPGFYLKLLDYKYKNINN